jgi:Asp-tRNA(Asn)/Glu-tRNA(Gln) amidotransferase A subunit family amidase
LTSLPGTTAKETIMLSALDLARRIERGELPLAAAVGACADAIAAREAEIGAFAALDLAAAEQQAKSSGERLAALPLRGLPIGVKDIIDTVDFPTSYGSPIYAGHRPVSDAAIVSMIRRAGGIVIGKTVTTPFAYLDPGKTRNPRNPAHTPGGSSSGSAAAVAAGMLPIALGTQTGGSIIRPASFCGVAGFKPSFRLLPTAGIKCFSWSLDTAGLFAASIADVAFATAAITGRDMRVDHDQPAPPRIALVRTDAWDEASDAMRSAIEGAARTAEAKGAHVSELVLPAIFEEAASAFAAIQGYEAWRAYAFEYDHHREQLPPRLGELLDKAAAITPEDYDAGRRVAKRARRILAELMSDVDVLLTPSSPTAAPKGLDFLGTPSFNRLWTLMGTPCINVPGLADAQGMPLGIQIVGRFARDRSMLAAALFVERAIV